MSNNDSDCDRIDMRDLTREFLQNIIQGDHENSDRQDGLLVEAKKKSKARSKKKEPDYGDGAYFVGEDSADIKAREDAWAGGDNVFNAIDYAKAGGSDPVTKEQEIMSITELRKMVQHEMGMLSETFAPPQNVDIFDMIESLRQKGLTDTDILYGVLSQEADGGYESMYAVSHALGAAEEMEQLDYEEDPTETAPMPHGSDDFSYTDLRRQWEEETG